MSISILPFYVAYASFVFLLILSILSVAFVCYKLYTLRYSYVFSDNLLLRVISLRNSRRLNTEDAIYEVACLCHLGRLFAIILRHHMRPIVDVREILCAEFNLIDCDLRHFLSGLSLIASISPFVGLLGAVSSVMTIFSTAVYVVEPILVDQAITMALENIALSLFVTIFSLAAYHYFKSKVYCFTLELKQQSILFLHYVFRPV